MGKSPRGDRVNKVTLIIEEIDMNALAKVLRTRAGQLLFCEPEFSKRKGVPDRRRVKPQGEQGVTTRDFDDWI